MKQVLVLTPHSQDFELLETQLGGRYSLLLSNDFEQAPELCRQMNCEFLFIDYSFCRGARWVVDFKNVFRTIWLASPTTEIILLCPPNMTRGAVYAVIAGAYNFLELPINPDELNFVFDSFVEQRQLRLELDYLRDEMWQDDSLELSTAASHAMMEVSKKARIVAPTLSTVLITGETGSGKGVLSRLIHKHSGRSSRPFVSIQCSAIPDGLLESELFGHERGAFTGAIRRKIGKFEAARGGTLFLDEIGTVPPATQVKLLQVLQERTFQRVGGEEMIPADVRIIAATNADLQAMIADKSFRRDLFYRLNVFPIEVPPLRDRLEDLPLLVEFFIQRLNNLYFKEIRDVHPIVMTAFRNYPWPGNIRELENLIERAYILENTPIMGPDSFPMELFTHEEEEVGRMVDVTQTLREVRANCVEMVERLYLRNLLYENRGSIKCTAEAAGIGVRQLHKLLTRYEIDKDEYKCAPKAASERRN